MASLILSSMVVWPVAVLAQDDAALRRPFGQRGQAPGTNQAPAGPGTPLDGGLAGINIAQEVHHLEIVAVTADARLVVQHRGERQVVFLWPLAIPGAESAAGANARRYLQSLVGSVVPLGFRERLRRSGSGGGEEGEGGEQGVLADLGADLLRRGMARYCPSPGVTLPFFAMQEEVARSRGRNLWGEAEPFSCPPVEGGSPREPRH